MNFEEILANIDWMALLSAVWTVVLVPIGKALYDYLKSKKLDGYAKFLYEEIVKAVKSINQTVVDDIKGTEGWTDEAKYEVAQLAKTKAIQALSSVAYRALKEANEDFDEYLNLLVESAVYDVKNGK